MGERVCYAGLLDEEGRVLDPPRIYLCRVYSPEERSGEVRGKRVLVDRVWPRGVKKETLRLDAWLRDVAPSDELRKWFGHAPARWEEFRHRYRAELAAPERQAAMQRLRSMVQEGPVTLLYGARDQEHNEAVVLKDVIERKLADETTTVTE